MPSSKKVSIDNKNATGDLKKAGPFIQNLNGSFNSKIKASSRASATNKAALQNLVEDAGSVGKFGHQVMHNNLMGGPQ